MESLTGFNSFQQGPEPENVRGTTTKTATKDGKELDRKEKSFKKKRHEKKAKKYKKRNRKSSSSESSDSENEKKYRKKRKKKQLKVEKSKHSLYDASKPDTIWLENTSLAPKDAFRIDRRFKKENLNYDSLYRLDIANYTRKSDIISLGLKKHQSIEFTDQRTKKKAKKHRHSQYRYFDPATQKELALDHDNSDQFPSEVSSKDGFMAINSFSNVNLNEKLTKDKSVDTNGESSQNRPEQNDLFEEGFTKRTEYFIQRLRDFPHDLDSWLEFAKLQDRAFHDKNKDSVSSTFSAGPARSKREVVITEKKMDILDKAIYKNPKSIRLIIEYMRCCRDVLDSAEVLKKWNEFTFKYPNKGLLWEEFLLFIPSDSSNFSTRNTVSAYFKCLKTLSSISDGSFMSHQPEENCAENILKIFLQYCLFLLQSGEC